MAYSKEYYELHKENYKNANLRYTEKNRDMINSKARERFNSLTEEEREERKSKLREKRAKNQELSKIQYRIDSAKRFLKKYEQRDFLLAMKDTWDSSDYRYSDELNAKIKYYNIKIEELKQEKERLLNVGLKK